MKTLDSSDCLEALNRLLKKDRKGRTPVERYLSIQDMYRTTNVEKNTLFQRAFNGFYGPPLCEHGRGKGSGAHARGIWGGQVIRGW